MLSQLDHAVSTNTVDTYVPNSDWAANFEPIIARTQSLPLKLDEFFDSHQPLSSLYLDDIESLAGFDDDHRDIDLSAIHDAPAQAFAGNTASSQSSDGILGLYEVPFPVSRPQPQPQPIRIPQAPMRAAPVRQSYIPRTNPVPTYRPTQQPTGNRTTVFNLATNTQPTRNNRLVHSTFREAREARRTGQNTVNAAGKTIRSVEVQKQRHHFDRNVQVYRAAQAKNTLSINTTRKQYQAVREQNRQLFKQRLNKDIKDNHLRAANRSHQEPQATQGSQASTSRAHNAGGGLSGQSSSQQTTQQYLESIGVKTNELRFEAFPQVTAPANVDQLFKQVAQIDKHTFGLQLTLNKMAGATEILAQSKQYLTQVLAQIKSAPVQPMSQEQAKANLTQHGISAADIKNVQLAAAAKKQDNTSRVNPLKSVRYKAVHNGTTSEIVLLHSSIGSGATQQIGKGIGTKLNREGLQAILESISPRARKQLAGLAQLADNPEYEIYVNTVDHTNSHPAPSTQPGAMGPNDGPYPPQLSTYKERLDQTPINNGQWIDDKGNEGVRGESRFIFDNGYVQKVFPDGIVYKNARPDLTPIALEQVTLKGFISEIRKSNFRYADIILADRLGVSRSDIEDFREVQGYAWHEHEDMRTLQLVPKFLHGTGDRVQPGQKRYSGSRPSSTFTK